MSFGRTNRDDRTSVRQRLRGPRRGLVVVVAVVAVVTAMFASVGISADEVPVPAAQDPVDVDEVPAPDDLPAPLAGQPGVVASVDLDKLETNAIRQWGVVGTGNSYTAPKPQVWDFTEIGDRIYVGGIFTGVQRNADDPSSKVESQAYLAAFDRDSGEWISTFRPTFNRAVYTLEPSPDGKLLVGGEFTSVNGRSRTGLVKLDPITGQTIESFPTYVTAGSRPMVRDIVVDGNDVYVAGQISNIHGPNGAPWVWNAARIDGVSGAVDLGFLPRYMGGVWQLALDKVRGRVHAAGFFSSVAGQSGTKSFASVTIETGAYIPGLTAYQHNEPNGQTDTVAVQYANDRIYVGGAQHIIQVLDAGDNKRLGFVTSGIACNNFSPSCGYTGGGDYQALQLTANGMLLGGCHCYGPNNNIYNSFTNSRTTRRFAHALDTTNHTIPSWYPNLKQRSYGTYSFFVDSNHCVYVGGDYVRNGDGSWLGGFGRYCEPAVAPTNLEVVRTGAGVRLNWSTPDTPLPIRYYKVYRNDTFAGDTTGNSFGFGELPVGSTQTFTVRTLDVGGRLSAPATITVTVPEPDNEPPTVPGDVDATVDGSSVTITWSPSTDLPDPGGVGVSGYLIHRDWEFIRFVPAGTHTFTDTDVSLGKHRYDVRAVDLGNRYSDPATVNVTIGVTDELPPTVPGDATATVDGSSVTITWSPSTDLPDPGGVGLSGYLIHRDWEFIRFVPAGTHTFTDTDVSLGNHRYEVRSVDLGNRYSQPAVLNVKVGPEDNEPPTVPTNVTGVVNGASVTLTWGPSVDLPDPGAVGLSGYLIHRDWEFIRFVPAGTHTFTDTDVAPGNHRYEVRAVDLGNRYSQPAPPVVVTVGG